MDLKVLCLLVCLFLWFLVTVRKQVVKCVLARLVKEAFVGCHLCTFSVVAL